MAADNWVFVRSLASLPGNGPDYERLRRAGWGGVLFDYKDPRLDAAIRAAQAAGVLYGIWGDPGQMDPVSFARTMAGLAQQYRPHILVPDIEFIGKGYQGTPGWEYNQRLAEEWRRLMPNQRTAVTVMPNQEDFNYEAWGNVQWMPQAYGADPRTQMFDPQDVINTLVKRGVKKENILPVLGYHGHNYQGPAALWTYDDFSGRELPTRPVGAPPAQQRVPDAQNPRAVQYANMRLNQLRNLGISIPDAADPTAAWRAASQNIAQIARERGFQDPRAFLRSGNRPRPQTPRR